MPINFSRLKHSTHARKHLTLDLTDAEYRALLRAVDVGSAIYGIMGDMVDRVYKPKGEVIDEVESKILEHAHVFGMSDSVTEFRGKLVLVDDYIEEVMDELLEFEDYAMWDNLVNRLARRDLSNKYDDKEWSALDDKTKIKLIFEAENKWWKEFENSGLDRIYIKDSE